MGNLNTASVQSPDTVNRNKSFIAASLSNQNYLLLIAALVILGITIVSRNIPFFWDSTYFAGGALFFYENGAKLLQLPQNYDTGGFPMYGLWMSAGWSLFGKSLLTSHLLMLPFLLLIVFEFFQICKRFLDARLLKWAMLLLFLEPTFITQSVLMAYDLMLLCFFLISLNAFLSGRKLLFTIAASLMILCSVRGIMLLVSLATIHLLFSFVLKEKPFKKHGFLLYIFPLLIWAAWCLWHYFITGWFIFSPSREHTHESFVEPTMMLRQIIYILWKLVDFGRIFLLLILGISIFIAIRKKSLSVGFKKLLIVTSSIILAAIIFMSPLSNPIGHRYLLPVIIMLPIIFLFSLNYFKNKKIRSVLIIIAAISLFSGNFWLYPEKYGNGWDCSLKVLPWFSMQREISDYVTEQNINITEIASEWPVISNPSVANLNKETVWCSDLNSGDIEGYKYILQSNISNGFQPTTILTLRQNWIVMHEWNSGQIYAVLYFNPAYKK
jgi:hypothetical protein